MFESATATPGEPRLFAIDSGVDFIEAFVEGFHQKTHHMAPEAIARCEIWVNTRRTQLRMREVFGDHTNALLPKIRLITQLDPEAARLGLPPAQNRLHQRLRLIPIVSNLIEASENLSSELGTYSLAVSLSDLLAEMEGEGVDIDVISSLPINDQSGHWERSLKIIEAVATFFDADDAAPTSLEGRNLALSRALVEQWRDTPPDHPIIVAGSTGSRLATRTLMGGVARLAQGAVVLPGVDLEMDDAMWRAVCEDQSHPQFCFARLIDELGGAGRSIIRPWSSRKSTTPARARLVSLALCPAPVTHFWSSRKDLVGPVLPACKNLTLLEAPFPRQEATAIALRLREAIKDKKKAALITPDRTLARRVTAALDRWDVIPDDSAGQPLALTPPGRLFRMLNDLSARPSGAEVITILRSPLVCRGDARGAHLQQVQDLELHLRKHGPVFPEPSDLTKWASKDEEKRALWAARVTGALLSPRPQVKESVSVWLSNLIERAEALCADPSSEPGDSGALWQDEAGREARRLFDELAAAAPAGGEVSAAEFRSILRGVLNEGEVRPAHGSHPLLHIWGSLEARVQGADLVIIGGLNEGTWPRAGAPDPWLNRTLREQAGLPLPDREIGLSAHDFQQAINANEVWLSRSTRSAETETVPSRWLNRFTNLLNGVAEGETALKEMRARAAPYLELAEQLDLPSEVHPAPRPSPVPPTAARPRKLSVTRIKTLIRDPYSIYARYILGLTPLEPLQASPDARIKGVILHECLEKFIQSGPFHDQDEGVARLLTITKAVLQERVAWPASRSIWLGHMTHIAGEFIAAERARQAQATPILWEEPAQIRLDDLDFVLSAKTDRIDRTDDDQIVIYDYKSGRAPSENEQLIFDKQLLLTAELARRGAFEKLGQAAVADAAFLSLSRSEVITKSAPLHKNPDIWTEFKALIASYDDPEQGYTPRAALWKDSDFTDYDTLSRFGEWSVSDVPQKVRLK